jgi:DNA polymerase III delta prime subunit
MTALAPEALDFDYDIKPFICEAIERSGRLPLNDEQILIIQGTWRGQDYGDMAQDSPYTAGHLQRTVAPDLWKVLSVALNIEIQKKTFRKIIGTLLTSTPTKADPSSPVPVAMRRIIGTPPSYTQLISRPEEFDSLTKLIEQNRVVLVTGSAGIGKTSLMSELFRQAKWLPTFQSLIWKYSVSDCPSDDIQDLLYLINSPSRSTVYDYIRTRRVLIAIDGIDDWFVTDKNRKDANLLLRRLAETEHNSCFIFSTRQDVPLVDSLSHMGRPVNIFHVKGLSEEQSRLLLNPYNLYGEKLDDFVSSRRGNPQSLHDSAKIVERIYERNVDPFMNSKTSIISNILSKSLSFSFNRIQDLDDIERYILQYLTTLKESLSVQDSIKVIHENLGFSIPQISKAIITLEAFGLIADLAASPQITIDNVIKKYIQLNSQLFPSLPSHPNANAVLH